ncbi:hypothetical protein [Pelagibius sp.]|uniref:hypothetical protein n=1 Tax=Pelagibius sp. TaxID=1931238 RepID=UPI003BAE1DD3
MSSQFWNTKGVIDMQPLENNTVGLKFAGEDDVNRVLTIPANHTAVLACALFELAGRISKTHDVGDTLTNLPNLSATSVAVGEARDGSCFSLVVRTGENVEMQVVLTAETTEALAAGLIEVLQRHGRAPQDLAGDDGPRH